MGESGLFLILCIVWRLCALWTYTWQHIGIVLAMDKRRHVLLFLADELGEFFQNLTRLIENTYYENNNSQVVLLGHSMGNPMLLYFLNRMDQAWKDKFIKAFVSLAGVWAGAVKPVRLMCSGRFHRFVQTNLLQQLFKDLTWICSFMTQRLALSLFIACSFNESFVAIAVDRCKMEISRLLASHISLHLCPVKGPSITFSPTLTLRYSNLWFKSIILEDFWSGKKIAAWYSHLSLDNMCTCVLGRQACSCTCISTLYVFLFWGKKGSCAHLCCLCKHYTVHRYF